MTRKDGSSWIILFSATPIFSLPALSFGAIAIEMTGSGKTMGSSVAGCLDVSQRMAGAGILHAQQRNDVARLRRVELLARVGVHFHDAANAFGLAGEGVEDGIAFA